MRLQGAQAHKCQLRFALHTAPRCRYNGLQPLVNVQAATGQRPTRSCYLFVYLPTQPRIPQGTHGFTLDPAVGEFMLTHPNITIPKRGQIYSLNDARYFDCECLSV